MHCENNYETVKAQINVNQIWFTGTFKQRSRNKVLNEIFTAEMNEIRHQSFATDFSSRFDEEKILRAVGFHNVCQRSSLEKKVKFMKLISTANL